MNAIKFETTRLHFSSDVFAAVADKGDATHSPRLVVGDLVTQKPITNYNRLLAKGEGNEKK